MRIDTEIVSIEINGQKATVDELRGMGDITHIRIREEVRVISEEATKYTGNGD